MFDLNKKMKLGILPGIANLYVRIQPDLQNKLNLFIKEVSDELQSEVLEVFAAPAADTLQSAEKAYGNLLSMKLIYWQWR